ncbi:MAG: (Fe-S)-binding protein [Deltaproteobacteria bacterium]|nr:(Fe-S)-binding protein [Deltaproteobacteria bacterium]
MPVHLFIPCLVDQFHPQVGKSVIQVLKRIGISVRYPQDQICCGQPFFKSGYWGKTYALARNTIRAFQDAKTVIAPSGSCVKMIRHDYLELFRDNAPWLERAKELSSKIYELSEFLIHIARVDDLGASYQGKVTYHDSCQVLRGLGISSEPRRLLRNVKGLELVEMEKSDRCCGFGGLFSFKFPHIARELVKEKAANILSSGAEAVTGCEISCLMNIEAYLKPRNIPIRILHLAEILAYGS